MKKKILLTTLSAACLLSVAGSIIFGNNNSFSSAEELAREQTIVLNGTTNVFTNADYNQADYFVTSAGGLAPFDLVAYTSLITLGGEGVFSLPSTCGGNQICINIPDYITKIEWNMNVAISTTVQYFTETVGKYEEEEITNTHYVWTPGDNDCSNHTWYKLYFHYAGGFDFTLIDLTITYDYTSCVAHKWVA